MEVKLWSFFFLKGVNIEFESDPIDFLLLILRKLEVPLLSHSFLLAANPFCWVLLYLFIEFSKTWGKYFLTKTDYKILWTVGLYFG